MVQQPFGIAGLQTGLPTTTLALPAIVTGQSSSSLISSSSQNQQQQQQQQQDNFYNQQQILKNNAPQYSYQQPRINGLSATNGLSSAISGQHQQQQQQQNSPNSTVASATSIQQDTGSLYNRAPLYASKPTYYTSQQQQVVNSAAVAAAAASAYSAQPANNQQQQSYYHNAIQQKQQQQQQQQPSPATAAVSLQQQLSGLSVRQMVLAQPVNLSPQQQVPAPTQQIQLQQQQAIEQQQRQQQMQLIMSYQQQQQQQLHNSLIQNNSTNNPIDQVIAQPTYAQHNNLNTQDQQQLQQDHRWNNNTRQEDQTNNLQPRHLYTSNHQHQHHYHHQQPFIQGERLVGPPLNANSSRHSARFSDRDSISTVSRFNQFDERRSVTMRSQYTSAKNSANFDKDFGFINVTTTAFKRLLGFNNANAGQNFNRNLQMSITENNKTSSSNINSQSNDIQSSAKVTVIDSAENHYFNKKVFKYQLVIMRCICFISAAFVLLSPVAMLLIPKMEHIFNTGSRDYSSDPTENNSPIPSVTHAVGLSGKQALGQRQSPYYTPQPQWRISECTSDCDGLLIGFVIRFLMLCIAYWAIFFRTQTSSLPRIDIQRCLLVSIAVLVTLSYWLFFAFRLFDKRFNDFELQYISIVQFSLSMLESLILLHYLAVILLELRSRKKVYCLKVVRSPDGESQYFSCGDVSIQKCAELVLEKYHRKFNQCGQYKELLLNLEDRLARNITSGGQKEDLSRYSHDRARPTSPANSQSGHRTSRRPSSRSSRHHSRTRSPSASPSRERSRPQKRSSNESKKGGVKVYEVDLDPPSNRIEAREEQDVGTSENHDDNSTINVHETSKNDNKHQDNDNSGDQSSDTTGKLKESSLETIRAANSTSDLISRPQNSVEDKIEKPKSSIRTSEGQRSNAHHSNRDETESVRSGRSRRSTSRHNSKHRDRERDRDRDHHHYHRERSSSRAHDCIGDQRHSTSVILPNSDPVEDHERKLRRRKFRLLVAVQDAFQQIKRTCEDHEHKNPNRLNQGANQTASPKAQGSTPNQTARSLYPRIARSLQKYLRLTGQTGNHNLQSIYEHLSKCLLYKLTPRAFLEKFFNQDPVWQQSETNLFANCNLNDSMLMCPRQKGNYFEINSWSLICDTLLSRQIGSGTFFVLKQGHVSLMVTVARMPYLNLTEEIVDQNACRFTMDSMETIA